MESGQLSAAVAAIKEKGILSGQRIERSESRPGHRGDVWENYLRQNIFRG
jgi:hypothetical protein